MDFSAAHTGFVIASYGLSALLLAGMTVYVIARDRHLRRAVEELKQREKP